MTKYVEEHGSEGLLEGDLCDRYQRAPAVLEHREGPNQVTCNEVEMADTVTTPEPKSDQSFDLRFALDTAIGSVDYIASYAIALERILRSQKKAGFDDLKTSIRALNAIRYSLKGECDDFEKALDELRKLDSEEAS